MTAIKGSGNTTTEIFFRNILKKYKVRGWHSKSSNVYGRPDFVFLKLRIAVFLDGCFWHGCPKCLFKKPKSNSDFWINKIERNKKRDKKVNRKLRSEGWKVLRIWEHSLKNNTEETIKRLKRCFNGERSNW